MPIQQFIQSVLGLVLLVSGSLALSNTEFTYNVIDGGIELTGCVDGCPSDLVIPEEIDGYSVTQVGYFAFEKQQMRSVVIPNSVIIIDSGAFKDNLLESVIFSTNITTIRYGAFKHNQLASVTIPNGLVIIEDESFADNKLVTLEIHDKVSIVDYGAFRDNQLSSITFLGEPPSIHSDSFSNNPLTTITYCQNDHKQWDGVIIEGITPQLDENCGDSNDHEDDHGHDDYEDSHCEENPGECSFLDGELVPINIDEERCAINPVLIEECILFDNGIYYEILEVHGDEDHHEEYCALHSDDHGDEDGHEEEHEDEHCYSPLDLDQNGSFEALTDALILLRYAFGLRGDNLISDAIATDANRTTAADIEAHIQSLLP
jgi:hypothetical protein